VTSLANDGESAASKTSDGDVAADAWNAVPRECEVLIGHTGPVFALSFCPVVDSMKEMCTELESSGTDGAPDPSDSSNSGPQRKRKRTKFPQKFIGPTYLLSSSSDCTIRLWNLHTLSNIAIYKAHIGPVWCVRFSQYGHFFVSGNRTTLYS
jgi:transcription initiation factor TFIID subunit 5